MQVNLVNQSIISAYAWEWSKFWLYHTRKHRSSFEITSFAPILVKTLKKSTSFYHFVSHSKGSVMSDYSERKKKNRKQLTLIHTPTVVQRGGGVVQRGGMEPIPGVFLYLFDFTFSAKPVLIFLTRWGIFYGWWHCWRPVTSPTMVAILDFNQELEIKLKPREMVFF